MGKFLAMRWLCLVFMLCSCATAPDPDVMRAMLTPEQVAQLRTPMIFVVAPTRRVAATLVPVGQNGGVRTWQTRDGVQIATQNGLVIASRGLGFDLMSADIGGTSAALRGGPLRYTRLVTYLSGDAQTIVVPQTCVMTAQGRQRHPANGIPVKVFVERCQTRDSFENTYHIGPDGTLWWSRQWVSAGVGALEIERIRR